MILLAGATGLVGRAVSELLPTGRRPWTEWSRQPRDPGWDDGPRRVVTGDVTDAAALAAALPEMQAVIHVAGVAPGAQPARPDAEVAAIRALIEVARARGVERFIFLSAAGAGADSGHSWLRAKGEAEALLRASGLPFVIVRASLITAVDSPWLHALHQVVRAGRKLRLPLLRAGRVQPSAVGDVAIALLTALDDHRVVGRTIEIGRAPALSLEELCELVARRLGRTIDWSRVPFVGDALEDALAAVPRTPLRDAAAFVKLFAVLEPASLAKYEKLLPMVRPSLADELRSYPWGAPPPRPGEPLPVFQAPEDPGLPLFIPGEAMRNAQEKAKLPPAWIGRVDGFGRGEPMAPMPRERSADEPRPDGESRPPPGAV